MLTKEWRDMSVRAYMLLDTVDAIIIPGGYAPDKMRLHQPMVDLIWKAYAKGKIIAAVCHGPQLLISADIVKGHRVTSWPSVPVDLKNAGATWVDEPVIRDGNIITRYLGRGFTCAGMGAKS
jgi:protease I